MAVKKKITTSRKKWDILGIGSPLLDVVININNKMFEKLNIKKGSMNLISEKESKNILKEFNHIKQKLTPGGSSANTLSGANALGSRVSFLGLVGRDEHGKIYREKMEKEGVASHLSVHDKYITGHSIILITPNGERTMMTHLGTAADFAKKHIKKDEIKNSKILHIEAYQFEKPKAHKALLHAIEIAKDNGVVISMDLSDVGLIQRNKKLFQNIIKEHINIVFANEEEAAEFANKNNSLEALREIAKICNIAVVKLGAKGSLIKKGEKIYNIKPHKVKVINTNGAGDMYAAGILHGLINELDLQEAGKIASHVSALVVASAGARLDKKHLNLIRKYNKNGKRL